MKLAGLVLLCAASLAQAADEAPDRLLADSLLAITQSRTPEALDAVDQLIRRHPDFRLAHLVKGDLLLARAQPLSTLGNTSTARGLDQLRDEARQRVRALTEPIPDGHVPSYLLGLASDHRYALVVDTSRSRLYVFENRPDAPRRVDDFYVTIGKAGAGKQKEGDNRTPLGIYEISGFKTDQSLDDFYGSGAYTLTYPNAWDQRLGRSGHGIWIHGSPSDTYSRSPLASEGCVVLANDDFNRLARYVRLSRTPVIIAERIDWVAPEHRQQARAELGDAIEQWRKDWESRDTERLLSHYSERFRSEQHTYASFSASKRKANNGKTWIRVELNQLNVMRYPEQAPRGSHPPLAQITFEQRYQSNNLSDRTLKRQYWGKENGRWKILHETTL